MAHPVHLGLAASRGGAGAPWPPRPVDARGRPASIAAERVGRPRKQRRLEETALDARPALSDFAAEEVAPTEVDPASSPASVPSSPESAPRAVPLSPTAAAPGVSAGASADADDDRDADELLQELLTPSRRDPAVAAEDEGAWLADLLTLPPRPAQPASTPTPRLARPASPPRSPNLDLSPEDPEDLQSLFNNSVAECEGLPVQHWNYDENKVHRALRALVDDSNAAFYVGATVKPRRRFLGGESRGDLMPGHCQCWHRMTVVHLANGVGARRVETNLIHYAMANYAHLCTNVAMDSRGVSPKWPSFIYVCSGRRTPGPPAGLSRSQKSANERAGQTPLIRRAEGPSVAVLAQAVCVSSSCASLVGALA